MDNNSFTVIELLVVIAIIGVLASIVLVSLSGTRDRAQIAKTLLYSNQIYHSLGADIVGNWNFDEGSGTTAIDSSGYNNTGTLVNGPTYNSDTPHKAAGQGSGKYALSFDGTDDYVDCGKNSNLVGITQKVTVEAWVNRNSSDDGGMVAGIWWGEKYALWVDANRHPLAYLRGSAGSTQKIASGVVNNNVWTHIVMTFDRPTVRLFINGVEDSSSPWTWDYDLAWSGVAMPFSIGGMNISGNSGVKFNGLIDEVRVYNAALTTSEIQQHYVQGLERHNNLAAK
jgi:prepilin-type N-terminal cleavage/methylation domain-containing protein